MTIVNTTRTPWNTTESVVFRFFLIYLVLQIVPWTPGFYRQLFSVSLLHLHYQDLFNLMHYSAQIVPGENQPVNWLIITGISLVATIGWSVARREPVNYDRLYYWLRVLVRYRLAIAVLGYGLLKLYPLQSPYPSLSNLNTPYGDFTRWKLFSITLGIVPSYETVLGGVEIVAALLLFFRKTASIGALIVTIFLGNVFMSNLAYEGGEGLYSLLLISFALFVLAYDVNRIVRLLVLQQPTAPNTFKPLFKKGLAQWRVIAKAAFILLFVFFYGGLVRYGFKSSDTLYPAENGLSKSSGLYAVTRFVLKGDSLSSLSPTDSLRWRDIVFESWNTLSIRSGRVLQPFTPNTDSLSTKDSFRTYEVQGAAARQYYSYVVDSSKQELRLKNKNPFYANDELVLHYEKLSPDQIALNGRNEQQDSIYVVLNKVKKRYLLEEVFKRNRNQAFKL